MTMDSRSGFERYRLSKKDSDKNFTMEHNENELIAFSAGWLGLSNGWYCKVSMRELCVVDFGITKRKALRYARKAWRKEFYSSSKLNENKYPRVIEC